MADRHAARAVAAAAAALACVVTACAGSSVKRPAGASPSTTAATTTSVATSTAAPTSVSSTTLGVLPPAVVNGLRVLPTNPPGAVVVPGARWLRVDRPDGKTQLVAILRPADGRRHPVIVYLHGSSGLGVLQLAWARRLVRGGFVVVAGCYLGVDPAAPAPHLWIPCPGLPDWQHSDAPTTQRGYDALLDVAQALPDAEPGALGVFGVSYGGITALTAAEPRVKAIVGDSADGKAGTGVVTAPVLLLGMKSDPRVPHTDVLAFEQSLRAAHKPVESHYYDGVGHVPTLQIGSPAIVADATSRALVFLRHALG